MVRQYFDTMIGYNHPSKSKLRKLLWATLIMCLLILFLLFPGGFPYPTISDMNLLNFLLDGNRMEKPNNCSDEMYVIIL